MAENTKDDPLFEKKKKELKIFAYNGLSDELIPCDRAEKSF